MPVTTQIRYAKTWQHSVNQEVFWLTTNAAFYQKVIRKIVTSLLGFANSAWTCWKSSDGSAVGTSAVSVGASNWAADTNLIWGATNGVNAHSWIVLAQSGLGGAQVLISLLGAGAASTVGKVAFSPGGLYTGGTRGDTDPTATDEITLVAAGGQLIAPSSAVYFLRSVVHASMSADGQCTRIWISGFQGIVTTGLIFDRLFDGPTDQPNPLFMYYAANDTAAFPTNASNFQSTVGKSYINGASADLILVSGAGQRDNWSLGQTLGNYHNDYSKKWPVIPVGTSSATRGAAGLTGTFYDLWHASTLLVPGACLGSQRKGVCVGGSLVFPWDGSANPKMGA